ncbi:MAG TPA: hypothetical protein V6D37_17645 [Candidatus Sericytochromatia bacterium]
MPSDQPSPPASPYSQEWRIILTPLCIGGLRIYLPKHSVTSPLNKGGEYPASATKNPSPPPSTALAQNHCEVAPNLHSQTPAATKLEEPSPPHPFDAQNKKTNYNPTA